MEVIVVIIQIIHVIINIIPITIFLVTDIGKTYLQPIPNHIDNNFSKFVNMLC